MGFIESLKLESLSVGDLIQISTHPEKGDSTPPDTYEIQVIREGQMPKCVISIIDKRGKVTHGPTIAFLEGTGHWTTPNQNPTQKNKAASINYGELRIGGFLITHDPERGYRKRTCLLPTCDEIFVSYAKDMILS